MSRLISKIICAITAVVVGPAACFPAMEYGAPRAQYKLDGQVVADVTGEPIEGIQVEFQFATVFTDSYGSFAIEGSLSPCRDECDLIFEDVDGEENGVFESKTVRLNPTQVEEGSGNWDEGSFEQLGIEVRLDGE